MDKKYYFIAYCERPFQGIFNQMIEEHPLEWQLKERTHSVYLVQWKEISEEEYLQFNEDFNNY